MHDGQRVGEWIIVGQVGDSRVYLARNGEVTQLTEDHTWLNVQVQHGRLTPAEARLKGNAGKPDQQSRQYLHSTAVNPQPAHQAQTRVSLTVYRGMLWT